jgi:hypothetical protein
VRVFSLRGRGAFGRRPFGQSPHRLEDSPPPPEGEGFCCTGGPGQVGGGNKVSDSSPSGRGWVRVLLFEPLARGPWPWPKSPHRLEDSPPPPWGEGFGCTGGPGQVGGGNGLSDSSPSGRGWVRVLLFEPLARGPLRWPKSPHRLGDSPPPPEGEGWSDSSPSGRGWVRVLLLEPQALGSWRWPKSPHRLEDSPPPPWGEGFC